MSEHAKHWQLDPEITFLNHGSFGACPTPVRDKHKELLDELEREPVAFFIRGFEARLDAVRDALGPFVGAPGEDLVFVNNATTGVNTVLRSLSFEKGSQLLTTDHVYNACRNVLDFVAEKHGAEVVIAKTPFPVSGPDEVFEIVMEHVTERTRFALLDHITSPTGIILPVDRLVPALREKGIEVMIDGAHAPGMLDLDIDALGAHYYTGNCHKWMCVPKGAAFLYVQRNRQQLIRPLSISHGANSPRTDRSRFLLEFDWPGTGDMTPWLCIPTAIEFLGTLFSGGWPALRRHNHELLLRGRDTVCGALGIARPAPDEMLGTLASMPLPANDATERPDALAIDPLQEVLFQEHRIEVPVFPWQAPGRLLRISAQAYNDLGQYEALAGALTALL